MEQHDYEFVWYGKHIIGLRWTEDGEPRSLSLHHLSRKPRDYFFLTPERLLKGDLSLTHDAFAIPIRAEPAATTVLAKLVANEVLDETHRYSAMVYQDLQQAFLRSVSHKANSIYAWEFFGADHSDGRFATRYLKVNREISPQQERLIKRVCSLTATPVTMRAYTDIAPACQEAFDALVDALRKVRKAEQDESERAEKSACAKH